ncbi:MAG: 6,7-dimethyl-8-ribityllumazine synthase [Ferruginibacter sp.]
MAIVDEAILNTTGIHLKDAFVVIIRTEWNAHVIDLLEQGAIKVLEEHAVRFKIINVPGAFEIPFTIRQYQNIAGKTPDAYIALACIIRGDTPHFDYVSKAVTDGVLQLTLSLPVPIIFGVLTVDNQVQANERTGGRHGHKGEEAAYTAIKMISISNSFKEL